MQRIVSSAAILFQLNNAIVYFKFAIKLSSCYFLHQLEIVYLLQICYLCVVVNVCDNNVLDVLLTVHLSIILAINQLNAPILLLQYVYYTILHVSSTMCSSSGGQNCIIQYLVSSHSVGGRPVHSPLSTCAPDGHLQIVTIPDAV